MGDLEEQEKRWMERSNFRIENKVEKYIDMKKREEKNNDTFSEWKKEQEKLSKI
jgi:hypothetical protein